MLEKNFPLHRLKSEKAKMFRSKKLKSKFYRSTRDFDDLDSNVERPSLKMNVDRILTVILDKSSHWNTRQISFYTNKSVKTRQKKKEKGNVDQNKRSSYIYERTRDKKKHFFECFFFFPVQKPRHNQTSNISTRRVNEQVRTQFSRHNVDK